MTFLTVSPCQPDPTPSIPSCSDSKGNFPRSPHSQGCAQPPSSTGNPPLAKPAQTITVRLVRNHTPKRPVCPCRPAKLRDGMPRHGNRAQTPLFCVFDPKSKPNQAFLSTRLTHKPHSNRAQPSLNLHSPLNEPPLTLGAPFTHPQPTRSSPLTQPRANPSSPHARPLPRNQRSLTEPPPNSRPTPA